MAYTPLIQYYQCGTGQPDPTAYSRYVYGVDPYTPMANAHKGYEGKDRGTNTLSGSIVTFRIGTTKRDKLLLL